MKAARLTDKSRIEIREVAKPTLAKTTDVLLRIESVGLCGSDIHYYKKGRIGDQVLNYPFTAGHESAGIIEETGAAVSGFEPGDKVAIDPAIVCGTCDQCRSRRPHTCRELRFLGCPGQREGSLSEYLVMPAANCFKLPPGMTAAQGVLAEPLSIGIYAVDFLENKEETRIAVLGTGPIGLSVILAARASGTSSVRATDKISERLEAARRAGAVWTGNPDHEDVVEGMLQLDPGGLDTVFECCGDQAALDQAVELLRPGGSLIIAGIPETDRVSFDISLLRRKEIRIQNVRRQSGCFSRSIELISQKKIDVDFMATHTFPLEKTEDAFELVAGYRDGVIKAMVLP